MRAVTATVDGSYGREVDGWQTGQRPGRLPLATPEEQFLALRMECDRRAARRLILAGTATMSELWLAFFGVGGNAGPFELEAYIFGMIDISSLDEERLAVVAAELQDRRSIS